MTASIDDGAEWLQAEREALARVDLRPEARSVGRVEEIADGVARVSGLPEARLGELLRFEGGRMGYALSLEAQAVNAAIFDEAEAIGVGSLVSATGEVARVPVGPGLLGRVIDPLGRPLDRDEAIAAEAFHPDRTAGAGDRRSRARQRAGRDRRARRRRAVCARARSARAHHRRPRHRQDGDRGRYDHQPEALRHDLRLCRGRTARDRGRAGDRGGQAIRRAGPLRVRRRLGGVFRRAAMDCALRRLHRRRIFPRQGRPCAGRRRRSHQACRDPSRARAADPRAARPRGLSRRRLLRPRAPARARR